MRIAIDAHAIGSRLTGNERYIENLAEQLLLLDRENEYFFFFCHEEAQRRWEHRAPNLKTVLVSSSPLRRLSVDFASELHRLRPEVFHYQYTGPLLHFAPEIVTIHDVSFERYPQFYRPFDRLRLKVTVRRAAKTARKIITVSEFSKREIVHFLGVPEHKINVIYNGVGPEFQPVTDRAELRDRLARYSLHVPYLLAVGNISQRKNHLAILRGFALWLSHHPDSEHQLVIAGKPGDAAQQFMQEAYRSGIDGQKLMLIGYVPDEDLRYLYAGAEMLLNLSVYEGFGLPLIEAMSCGVPVIASYASCFPEIAEDAARYVNPEDSVSVADAIRDILENTVLRAQLIERGLNRAKCFRWDAAAQQTLAVYHEATGATASARLAAGA